MLETFPNIANHIQLPKVEAQPDDTIDLEQEVPEEQNAEIEEPQQEKIDENVEGGFFEQPPPEDAEKQKVVEEVTCA